MGFGPAGSARPPRSRQRAAGRRLSCPAHAALALSAVGQVRHLQAKADSRDIIGQAKGILMERHKLTGPQAFQKLVLLSQTHNMQLRNVCEQLAATGALPGE